MKVSEFLKGLSVDLTEEQVAAVDSKLRVKSERKTAEAKFEFVGEPEGKLPNQAKFLLQAIADADEPVTYVEWGQLAVAAGMGTRQDPARIAAYYRPLLEKAGAIKHV